MVKKKLLRYHIVKDILITKILKVPITIMILQYLKAVFSNRGNLHPQFLLILFPLVRL